MKKRYEVSGTYEITVSGYIDVDVDAEEHDLTQASLLRGGNGNVPNAPSCWYAGDTAALEMNDLVHGHALTFDLATRGAMTLGAYNLTLHEIKGDSVDVSFKELC